MLPIREHRKMRQMPIKRASEAQKRPLRDVTLRHEKGLFIYVMMTCGNALRESISPPFDRTLSLKERSGQRVQPEQELQTLQCLRCGAFSA